MKKFYFVALMAAALATTGLTSCGDDDSISGEKTKTEEATDNSQWKSNIIGTWKYDSGLRNGSGEESNNGVKTQFTFTTQDVCTITVSASGTGTYSDVCTNITKNEDGSTYDGSYSYNVSFTYEYVASSYSLADEAYLKCTVTKTDNERYSVGEEFCIGICEMTKNSAEMFTSTDGWNTKKVYTRQ